MPSDQYYRAALKFVNDFRVDLLGLPPIPALPEGYPARPEGCPVAKGVNQGTAWRATANAMMVEVYPHSRLTPPEVVTFLARFDRGFYPELIASWAWPLTSIPEGSTDDRTHR